MLLVGVPDLVLERWLLEEGERELELEPLGACGRAAAEPRRLTAASDHATCLQVQCSMARMCLDEVESFDEYEMSNLESRILIWADIEQLGDAQTWSPSRVCRARQAGYRCSNQIRSKDEAIEKAPASWNGRKTCSA